MRQPGEITQVKNGMTQITFCRPEACAACNACEGGKKEHVIWVRGTEGNVGDIAIVDMPDTIVARASFIAYGLPLITLLLGMILGNVLAEGQDLGTALGAIIGLAAGMLLLKLTEKRRIGRDEWTPKIVDVLEKSMAGEV